MKKLLVALLFVFITVSAQDKTESSPSFFDDSEAKEFSLKTISVEGEVENPGAVDLSLLPLHSFPFKDVVYGGEKNKFNGSYYVSGYSLFDIINLKKVKKVNEAEFKPAVDLYVVVENDNGDKAVFSWGELFYTRDNYKAIISKSIRGINPSKMKMKWPLPETYSIICGNDAFNFRNISTPTKITVKTFAGDFSKEGVKETYSSEIKVVSEDQIVILKDLAGYEKRKFRNLGYGHGMGWKGINDVEGFVLKNILFKNVKLDIYNSGKAILCFSAKDGYRATYSLSEIINRVDMNDFLLAEKNDSKEDGKYNLFATPDFFVDRNVRSVEKIEMLIVK